MNPLEFTSTWECVDNDQIFNYGWTFLLILDGINVETEEGYVWADSK